MTFLSSKILTAIKTAPQEPGCYVFHGKSGVLYVGKASNLRNRLRSYLKAEDMKTESLHQEATSLELITLRSEIEALIEESRLIKELKPRYNILWRDDKSYLYVYFTKETFPKIFVGHETLTAKSYKLKASRVGPLTDGSALRTALKVIRRYFPYCTCLPAGRLAAGHLRNCLNAQIGKCLGFCCQKNLELTTHNKQLYAKNIRIIKKILRGESQKLLKNLKDEKEKMALGKIFAHQPYLSTNPSLNATRYTLNPQRVECYDISNLAGKETVGAMTVLVRHSLSEVEGQPWISNKNSYRKFIIKSSPKHDDPRAIAEILERRLRHPEWPYPDLIIIDGGLTQYRAAKQVISHSSLVIDHGLKLISFAKPNKEVYGLKENDAPTPLAELPTEFQKLIELAIYQTHRFVIRYHRDKRSKELFN